MLFLACATVFINLECGSSAEPVCEHFAIAAIGLLLFGVAVGLLTPVLSSLQNRRLRKARQQLTPTLTLTPTPTLALPLPSQAGSVEWRTTQNKGEGGDYGHHMSR